MSKKKLSKDDLVKGPAPYMSCADEIAPPTDKVRVSVDQNQIIDEDFLVHSERILEPSCFEFKDYKKVKSALVPKQQNLSVAGFKAANRILLSWGSSPQQIQSILKVSSVIYDQYNSNPESVKLDEEQLIRISYLLNIHQAIRLTFENQENVTGFMRMENGNTFFEGRKPIDIISSGNIDDLYEVACRVEAITL
ncbi:hypothetical protein [Alginatibacterium sediminis]|uniref:hypothetical protein n=1 Tax=Alginatibacterium sediminis TaxID=2164068 RepID=UPI0018F77122|nr:hypothetical protein [Alginatibacterium sediminis]